MDGYAQKRIIRKLDLELFLASLAPMSNPKVELEQYTTPAGIAANILYLAAYNNGDIDSKSVLDLACGTGRLGLGALFLGAREVVGIDIDPKAIKTARWNASSRGLKFQLITGDVNAIIGNFDTVLQNPPFGVQNRESDREFLVRALEVSNKVYSVHNHPEVDGRLINVLKSNSGMMQVQPNAFIDRFIAKNGGSVEAVYAMLMSIPKMFDFHHKLKHDFVIDLYVIKKR
jgi:putative methylase